jgi:broad specificity phosphatase PhoE
LQRAQETLAPLAERLKLPVTTEERVIEAGNRFEGKKVGVGPKAFLNPAFWPLLWNPFTPSWGEPYVEIAERMQAAVHDARAAAEGHEAVIVSHQLPVWIARCAYEGRKYAHDPRNRECTLASVTSLQFEGDRFVGLRYSEPARHLLGDSTTFVGGA